MYIDFFNIGIAPITGAIPILKIILFPHLYK